MEGGTPRSETEDKGRAADSTPPAPRQPWWRKLRGRAPFNWPRRRKLRWFVAIVLSTASSSLRRAISRPSP